MDVQHAVAAVIGAYVDTWNRHDVDGLAALFAEDADYVNVVGNWMRGRDGVFEEHELSHRTMFAASRLSVDEPVVRLLAPGVASAHTVSHLVGHRDPRGREAPPWTIHSTAVLVERDGAWPIVTWQNSWVGLPGVTDQVVRADPASFGDRSTGDTAPHATTPRENEQLFRDVVAEFFNAHDPGAADRFYAPDYRQHSDGVPDGRDGLKAFFTGVFAAFPDLVVTVDHLHAVDDRVFAFCTYRGTHRGEFLGVPPTGRAVRFRTANLQRVADGRFAEHWELVDMQALLLELGVLTTTRPAAAPPPVV